MLMHVVWWDKNFAAPRQHYLNMFPGTEDFLWDDPWFRRRCGGNEHFVVDVWQIEMANWKRELANQIKVLADDTSPAILLRPTEHSPFGRHDLRDFFGTRTTRVFAWAQGETLPCLFYVSLNDTPSIVLQSYIPIARHVLGPDYGDDNIVEVWTPRAEGWSRLHITSAITFSAYHTSLLVRFPGAAKIRGSGRRIANLQRETFEGWLNELIEESIDDDANKAAEASRLTKKRRGMD
ncbi:hypothetical protein C8Q76DRAFT_801433 [Earliella scabrosa]|nr:hypothetical protein C8Q76DRAFT_801433 [Earliella scabrosa]